MNSPLSFLPYGRHLIEDDDVENVVRILRGDWLTTGPTTREFEQAFAEAVSVPYAVSCSSGTAALHMAAAALGLGPGDKVIVPAITFAATANAVCLVGADVFFADVDPTTGLMTAETFEQALKSLDGVPAAVFPVHLAGQSVDMAEISSLILKVGGRVVEDAAHALGTVASDGAAIGACRHSDMAIFSLHPVKTVAMGEGGVVTTRDKALHAALCSMRNHGIVRDASSFVNYEQAFGSDGAQNPWYYEIQSLGLNYRASDLHCALGVSQLHKLEKFISKREALVKRYDELLAPFASIIKPLERVSCERVGWHLYSVRIDFDSLRVDRATLMSSLQERGIGTQVHYIPLYRHPYYQKRYGAMRLTGAELYYATTLSLPLHVGMEEHHVERVVDNLVELIA